MGNEVRILLDTHALLWFEEGDQKLGAKARSLMEDTRSEVWISAASVWEIANKAARHRLQMSRPLSKWLPRKMREQGFFALGITLEHAIAAAELPRHHEDPFDRMLIGQALIEGLRIMTADAQFERYDVSLIDATD